MRRIIALALICAMLLVPAPVVAARGAATITATPAAVALGGTIDLAWSDTPTTGQSAYLEIVSPCFDAIEVLDLYTSSSWQFVADPCPGTYTFEIVQGPKVLAAATALVV